MKKKFIIASLPLVFASGFFIGTTSSKADTSSSKYDDYHYIKLFMEVFKIVKDDYVVEPSTKKMIYGALNGMLQSLDPFSNFFTPSEYKEFTQDTEGKFGGIGIEIAQKHGRPVVVTPIEDTPAYKAGIKPGDIIIAIDGKDTLGMSVFKIVKMIKGKPGTKVSLTLLRKGEDKPITVTLTREIINVPSVKYTMIDKHIGYVKLIQFQEHAYRDLANAIELLRKEGANEFILDLRNDPGGLLEEAIKVSNIFLPKDSLIVETKGRVVGDQKYYAKQANLLPENIPVVVLINEGTASAAEIVTGALKDYERAVIVGQKSFGKGSVQNLIPLPGGCGIKLTIAHWYTPKGHLIDKKGIMPNLVVKMTPKQEEDLFKDIENIKINTGKQGVVLLPDKDLQLKEAIKILEDKKLYEQDLKLNPPLPKEEDKAA